MIVGQVDGVQNRGKAPVFTSESEIVFKNRLAENILDVEIPTPGTVYNNVRAV